MTPGALGFNESGNYVASGLTFHDTYQFRIRADHADGTASTYVTGSVTARGLSAPAISATAQQDFNSHFILVHWDSYSDSNGQSAASYDVQWRGSNMAGHGWTSIVNASSNMHFDIGGGQVAQFRVRAAMSDGTLSEWGESDQVTEDGGMGPLPDVTATTVSDTEVKVTFTGNPDTVNNEVYYFVTYNAYDAPGDAAKDATPEFNTFVPDASGTAYVTGLTPGTKYDFKVTAYWHTPISGDNHDDAGMSIAHADATTSGSSQVKPTAPSFIRGSYEPTGGGNTEIQLYWANSSNNEDHFLLFRSRDADTYSMVTELSSDETTFTQSVSGVGPWYYMVKAENDAGLSSGAEVAINPAIGGPDITSHLMAIASDVDQKWRSLSALTGFRLGGNSLLPLTGINGFGMSGFTSGGYGNGAGGVLGTVTGAGKVFDEKAVNYWLAGVIYRELLTTPGGSATAALFKAEAFTYVHTIQIADVPSEKWAWFEAGASLDPSSPASPPNLHLVVPNPIQGGPIDWDWGSLSGRD